MSPKASCLFFFFSILIIAPAIAQQGVKYSVHGTVKSAQTGETVISATLSVEGSGISTTSNEYGFYSLTLTPGNYTLLVSSAGMQGKQVQVALTQNIQMDILLEPAIK